jgi:hypothetical protein
MWMVSANSSRVCSDAEKLDTRGNVDRATTRAELMREHQKQLTHNTLNTHNTHSTCTNASSSGSQGIKKYPNVLS